MSQEGLKRSLEEWMTTKRGSPASPEQSNIGRLLQKVNLSDIEMSDSPFALRGKTDWPTLKNSLKDQGQKYPIILKKEEGRYRIVAGFRRLKALNELGYSSVMAVVYDKLTDEEMELFYLLDVLLYQEADLLRLSELLSEKDEILIKSLGISQALYDSFVKITLASEEIKEALSRQDISLKQLLEILKSDHPQELLEEVLASQVTSREMNLLNQLISLRKILPASGEEIQKWIDIESLAIRVYKDLKHLSEKIKILKEVYPQIPLDIRKYLVTELKELEETGIFNIIHQHPGAEHLYEEVTGEDYEEIKILSDELFNTQVLNSEIPVVVNLNLEGYPPCEELQQALGMLQAKYHDKLKFYAVNIMESDLGGRLPHLVKIGKDFMIKNLPRIMIFWKGKKVAESNKIDDLEEVFRLVRSVIKA
jgi:ParB family chromosome partitioning protein